MVQSPENRYKFELHSDANVEEFLDIFGLKDKKLLDIFSKAGIDIQNSSEALDAILGYIINKSNDPTAITNLAAITKNFKLTAPKGVVDMPIGTVNAFRKVEAQIPLVRAAILEKVLYPTWSAELEGMLSTLRDEGFPVVKLNYADYSISNIVQSVEEQFSDTFAEDPEKRKSFRYIVGHWKEKLASMEMVASDVMSYRGDPISRIVDSTNEAGSSISDKRDTSLHNITHILTKSKKSINDGMAFFHKNVPHAEKMDVINLLLFTICNSAEFKDADLLGLKKFDLSAFSALRGEYNDSEEFRQTVVRLSEQLSKPEGKELAIKTLSAMFSSSEKFATKVEVEHFGNSANSSYVSDFKTAMHQLSLQYNIKNPEDKIAYPAFASVKVDNLSEKVQKECDNLSRIVKSEIGRSTIENNEIFAKNEQEKGEEPEVGEDFLWLLEGRETSKPVSQKASSKRNSQDISDSKLTAATQSLSSLSFLLDTAKKSGDREAVEGFKDSIQSLSEYIKETMSTDAALDSNIRSLLDMVNEANNFVGSIDSLGDLNNIGDKDLSTQSLAEIEDLSVRIVDDSSDALKSVAQSISGGLRTAEYNDVLSIASDILDDMSSSDKKKLTKLFGSIFHFVNQEEPGDFECLSFMNDIQQLQETFKGVNNGNRSSLYRKFVKTFDTIHASTKGKSEDELIDQARKVRQYLSESNALVLPNVLFSKIKDRSEQNTVLIFAVLALISSVVLAIVAVAFRVLSSSELVDIADYKDKIDDNPPVDPPVDDVPPIDPPIDDVPPVDDVPPTDTQSGVPEFIDGAYNLSNIDVVEDTTYSNANDSSFISDDDKNSISADGVRPPVEPEYELRYDYDVNHDIVAYDIVPAVMAGVMGVTSLSYFGIMAVNAYKAKKDIMKPLGGIISAEFEAINELTEAELVCLFAASGIDLSNPPSIKKMKQQIGSFLLKVGPMEEVKTLLSSLASFYPFVLTDKNQSKSLSTEMPVLVNEYCSLGVEKRVSFIDNAVHMQDAKIVIKDIEVATKQFLNRYSDRLSVFSDPDKIRAALTSLPMQFVQERLRQGAVFSTADGTYGKTVLSDITKLRDALYKSVSSNPAEALSAIDSLNSLAGENVMAINGNNKVKDIASVVSSILPRQELHAAKNKGTLYGRTSLKSQKDGQKSLTELDGFVKDLPLDAQASLRSIFFAIGKERDIDYNDLFSAVMAGVSSDAFAAILDPKSLDSKSHDKKKEFGLLLINYGLIPGVDPLVAVQDWQAMKQDNPAAFKATSQLLMSVMVTKSLTNLNLQDSSEVKIIASKMLSALNSNKNSEDLITLCSKIGRFLQDPSLIKTSLHVSLPTQELEMARSYITQMHSIYNAQINEKLSDLDSVVSALHMSSLPSESEQFDSNCKKISSLISFIDNANSDFITSTTEDSIANNVCSAINKLVTNKSTNNLTADQVGKIDNLIISSIASLKNKLSSPSYKRVEEFLETVSGSITSSLLPILDNLNAERANFLESNLGELTFMLDKVSSDLPEFISEGLLSVITSPNWSHNNQKMTLDLLSSLSVSAINQSNSYDKSLAINKVMDIIGKVAQIGEKYCNTLAEGEKVKDFAPRNPIATQKEQSIKKPAKSPLVDFSDRKLSSNITAVTKQGLDDVSEIKRAAKTSNETAKNDKNFILIFSDNEGLKHIEKFSSLVKQLNTTSKSIVERISRMLLSGQATISDELATLLVQARSADKDGKEEDSQVEACLREFFPNSDSALVANIAQSGLLLNQIDLLENSSKSLLDIKESSRKFPELENLYDSMGSAEFVLNPIEFCKENQDIITDQSNSITVLGNHEELNSFKGQIQLTLENQNIVTDTDIGLNSEPSPEAREDNNILSVLSGEFFDAGTGKVSLGAGFGGEKGQNNKSKIEHSMNTPERSNTVDEKKFTDLHSSRESSQTSASSYGV